MTGWLPVPAVWSLYKTRVKKSPFWAYQTTHSLAILGLFIPCQANQKMIYCSDTIWRTEINSVARTFPFSRTARKFNAMEFVCKPTPTPWVSRGEKTLQRSVSPQLNKNPGVLVLLKFMSKMIECSYFWLHWKEDKSFNIWVLLSLWWRLSKGLSCAFFSHFVQIIIKALLALFLLRIIILLHWLVPKISIWRNIKEAINYLHLTEWTLSSAISGPGRQCFRSYWKEKRNASAG